MSKMSSLHRLSSRSRSAVMDFGARTVNVGLPDFCHISYVWGVR